MIAVDTTVLADWFFNGGKMRDAVLKLQEHDSNWVCVSLAQYEVGNVAWKLMRAGRLGLKEVFLAWEALRLAEIEMIDEVDWQAVTVLAASKEISFYDAAHVWVAMSRGIPLYSRDGALKTKCPEVVRAMHEVLPGES